MSADGPDKYIIRGTFNARCAAGALTTQYVTFGYGADSESWHYKTYACDDESLPADITINRNRSAGDKVHLIVGATSGVLNIYGYGPTVIANPDA